VPAATWAVGAFASGPLHLGPHRAGRLDRGPARPVASAVVLGSTPMLFLLPLIF